MITYTTAIVLWYVVGYFITISVIKKCVGDCDALDIADVIIVTIIWTCWPWVALIKMTDRIEKRVRRISFKNPFQNKGEQ